MRVEQKFNFRLGGCYYKSCGMSIVMDDETMGKMFLNEKETVMRVVIFNYSDGSSNEFVIRLEDLDLQDPISFVEYCVAYVKGYITGVVKQTADLALQWSED